jgi:hypothetical protein
VRRRRCLERLHFASPGVVAFALERHLHVQRRVAGAPGQKIDLCAVRRAGLLTAWRSITSRSTSTST